MNERIYVNVRVTEVIPVGGAGVREYGGRGQ